MSLAQEAGHAGDQAANGDKAGACSHVPPLWAKLDRLDATDEQLSTWGIDTTDLTNAWSDMSNGINDVDMAC